MSATKFVKVIDGHYRYGEHVEILRSKSHLSHRPGTWWVLYVGDVRMHREYPTLATAQAAVRKAAAVAGGICCF